MREIIPAVLERSEEEFRTKVQAIPAEVEFIHIDVLEADVFAGFNKFFEAHLMVEEPEKLMELWVKRGAKRVIVHKLSPAVLDYKGKTDIGLGVEMKVPLEEVFPLFQYPDFVQLMAIDEIGEQGRPLDGRIFDRIREVKEKFPYLPLSVDGGVNAKNYEKLWEAGANRLVVGSGFNELWTLQMKKS